MSKTKTVIMDAFNTCKLHFKNGETIEISLIPFKDNKVSEIMYALIGCMGEVRLSNPNKMVYVITKNNTYLVYSMDEVSGIELGFDIESDLRFYWGDKERSDE